MWNCTWPLLPDAPPAAPWLAGLMMVVLTVAFEFGFGRFIRHLPWSTLLQDYNFGLVGFGACSCL